MMMPQRRRSIPRGVRLAVLLTAVCAAASLACAARAQEAVLSLDPAHTEIHFSLGSTLHAVHGIFKLKSGEIHFDSSTGKASGSIVVDAASGDSDNKGRDKKMRQEILETPKFGEIVFMANGVKGAIASQGASQVQLSGVLRLHGQDHDMTLSANVVSTGGRLQATTHFSVPYVKWGLKNPSTFLLRADDTVDIDIQASGELATAPTEE
jgi:polyisoprenoid-binding protein YceI